MPDKRATVLIVLFTLLLFVAAFVLLSTIAPDTLQTMAETAAETWVETWADAGATPDGKCIGSGAGSCDVGST